MAKRKSFVFYESWKEVIDELSQEVQLEIYQAITEYAINGNLPELKPMAKIAFAFIKQDLDRDAQAYIEKCRINSENAKKGGAPQGNSNAKKQPKTTETTERLKKQPKQPYYDDEDDNDINNSSTNVLLSGTSQPHPEKIDYKSIVDFFNSESKGIFGNIRMPLSDKRKQMLGARIKEHGKSSLLEVIKKAGASDFMRGQNQRGWIADFDWMIRPTNFEKILSGNYDNKNKRITEKTGIDEDFARNIAEGIARSEYNKNRQ